MPEIERLPGPDTLEFIYTHTRGALDGHLSQARGLDGKVAQIFAAATVVIGLAGASHDAKAPGGVLVAALVFYGLTLLGAVLGLWPVALRGSDYGKTMWPEHFDQQPEEIEHAIVADIAEASGHNEAMIRAKAWVLMVVLITTGVEAILVGIALTVSRIG